MQSTMHSQLKKTLLITCAAATILPVALSSSEAHASNWRINDILNEAAIEKSFCVANKTFKDDILVNIARNIHGETSIAFDYQRSVFDTARQLKIVLGQGSESLTYVIKPSSEQALVLRGGANNAALWDLLSTAQTLPVKIGGVSYSFNMKEFSASVAKDFTNCVESLVPQMAPIAAITPPLQDEIFLEPEHTMPTTDLAAQEAPVLAPSAETTPPSTPLIATTEEPSSETIAFIDHGLHTETPIAAPIKEPITSVETVEMPPASDFITAQIAENVDASDSEAIVFESEKIESKEEIALQAPLPIAVDLPENNAPETLELPENFEELAVDSTLGADEPEALTLLDVATNTDASDNVENIVFNATPIVSAHAPINITAPNNTPDHEETLALLDFELIEKSSVPIPGRSPIKASLDEGTFEITNTVAAPTNTPPTPEVIAFDEAHATEAEEEYALNEANITVEENVTFNEPDQKQNNNITLKPISAPLSTAATDIDQALNIVDENIVLKNQEDNKSNATAAIETAYTMDDILTKIDTLIDKKIKELDEKIEEKVTKKIQHEQNVAALTPLTKPEQTDLIGDIIDDFINETVDAEYIAERDAIEAQDNDDVIIAATTTEPVTPPVKKEEMVAFNELPETLETSDLPTEDIQIAMYPLNQEIQIEQINVMDGIIDDLNNDAIAVEAEYIAERDAIEAQDNDDVIIAATTTATEPTLPSAQKKQGEIIAFNELPETNDLPVEGIQIATAPVTQKTKAEQVETIGDIIDDFINDVTDAEYIAERDAIEADNSDFNVAGTSTEPAPPPVQKEEAVAFNTPPKKPKTDDLEIQNTPIPDEFYEQYAEAPKSNIIEDISSSSLEDINPEAGSNTPEQPVLAEDNAPVDNQLALDIQETSPRETMMDSEELVEENIEFAFVPLTKPPAPQQEKEEYFAPTSQNIEDSPAPIEAVAVAPQISQQDENIAVTSAQLEEASIPMMQPILDNNINIAAQSNEQALLESLGAPAPQVNETVASAPSPIENFIVEGPQDPIDDTVIETQEIATAQSFVPGVSIQNMLENAEITDTIQISNRNKRQQQTDNNDIATYQWNVFGVFGSSEQYPFQSEAKFEDNIAAYLNQTESRCDGDFSIVPHDSFGNTQNRVDSYDIACVTDTIQSSATLVFFVKNDTVNVVAHETTLEDMEAAMTLRDRLLNILKT